MGFINNAKANEATRVATEAYSAGRQILVFKIIEANSSHRHTGLMAGVGEQVEAIEAQGWILDRMAGAEGKALTGERTALICLFRRR
ncbi:hypothetical protein H1V43_04500 [Streptomyces sp. PSKA54]|uniref:Uncharacterized protein n=1 Tax=Streptomyces himalayensis subsp. aureolus TaxID=2758039 RepID=A0A7W2CX24_9ACTN|nr:hypothetical protein [Streptomyces himalayensis]MBA4860649.1 hypothetical protein [Streptomyces himalayensis subsp. aureolus]